MEGLALFFKLLYGAVIVASILAVLGWAGVVYLLLKQHGII